VEEVERWESICRRAGELERRELRLKDGTFSCSERSARSGAEPTRASARVLYYLSSIVRSVRIQEVNGYLYVRLWDKQLKRPRRFYLGKSSDPRVAELLKAAAELKVPREEVEDYLARQVDPAARTTKPELAVLSVVLGVLSCRWSGGSRAR